MTHLHLDHDPLKRVGMLEQTRTVWQLKNGIPCPHRTNELSFRTFRILTSPLPASTILEHSETFVAPLKGKILSQSREILPITMPPTLSRHHSMFWKELDHPPHSFDPWPYDFHVFCFLKKALKNHEEMTEMLCSGAMVHGVLWGMDPSVSVSVGCWTHCPLKILLMVSFLCPEQSLDGVQLNELLTINCSNMHIKLCAQFLTCFYMMQIF
jgi:hypothetical protein